MIAGLIGLGIVASALSVNRAQEKARETDRDAVMRAADRLSIELRGALSALQGIDGIAADSTVTSDEFSAFAADVLAITDYSALAFSDVVSDVRRDSWEATTGIPIKDSDQAGGFTKAAMRRRHVVIRLVHPATDAARAVLGFDFMSDDVRARAVSESTRVDRGVLVGPIRLASSAEPGLFVMHAVHAPTGQLVGFVSSGKNVDTLVKLLRDFDPKHTFALRMDDAWLFGRGVAGRPTTTFKAGERVFTLQVNRASSPDWTTPLLVIGGTVLLLGLAFLTLRREFADRARIRSRASRNERIAVFAEGASVLDATREVLAYSVRHASEALGADRMSIARLDLADPTSTTVSVSRRNAGGTMTAVSSEHIGELHPVTECLRGEAPAWRRSRGSTPLPALWLNPPVSGPSDHAGSNAPTGVALVPPRAVLCIPLSLGSERQSGVRQSSVLCFEWENGVSRSDMEDFESAGLLVTQIIERCYERARAQELVQAGLRGFSTFTRALTTSRTSAEVQTAVEQLLPPLFDVRAVELQSEPNGTSEDSEAVRCYSLVPAGTGRLIMSFHPTTNWISASETLANTMVDLVSAALDRTRSYDEQRKVLQRLQYSLLSPPPRSAGYDIAVAYQSAVEAIGIGGDWYSVIDTETHLFAVIGDVVGHGAEAVAVMAEVKTIVRYLLTTAADISHVVQEADRILGRRGTFASLLAVAVEKSTGNLEYISAGHLPPVLLGDTPRALESPQGPWLGMPDSSYTTAVGSIQPGETLVLYTDGLIEQRGVALDQSIIDFIDRMPKFEAPEELLASLLQTRSSEKTVDDDVAVLVITRT